MVPNVIQPMAHVRAQRDGMEHFVRNAVAPIICLAKNAITHANVTRIIQKAVTHGLENVTAMLDGAVTCVIGRARSSRMVKIARTNATATERSAHQQPVNVFVHRAIKGKIARNNVTKDILETVRKNVTVPMENAVRKPGNAFAPWDGKDIIVTDRVMKDHLVKIAKSHAIAEIMALAIHNLVYADAVLVGKGRIANKNVNSGILDSIARKSAIVISIIQLPVMPSMDTAFVRAHGQVSIAKQNVHPVCMEMIVKMCVDVTTIHRVMHKVANVFATKVGKARLVQSPATKDTMA